MPFNYIRLIPTPEEIKNEMPLTDQMKKDKATRDKELRAVFEKKSSKFVLVIGPCSAHDENAVIEYNVRLAKLQERVKDKILLVPRIYTNKPRTTGAGYKGMVHQPDPTGKPNIVEGLKAIRHMHIRSLGECGLPAADEMLYPNNFPYLEDILSYVAVGARSVENQSHRLTASGMDVPAGMKNPTSGDFEVMLNSIQAAQIPQDFIYNGWEVSTPGNPLAHAILRGAFNQHGQNIPNYHFEALERVVELYKKRKLLNPAVLIDTNHANSAKRYKQQSRIALDVMKSRQQSDSIKNMVKGLMIESFLVEGNQKEDGTVYGQSITDPCLGWSDTETLVLRIGEFV